MIDDDRRVLADMQHHLLAADPAFVARMSEPAPRPFPTLTVLGIGMYVLAPLISLLFGGAAVAVAAAPAVVAAVIVAVRRRRAGPPARG